MEKDIINKGFAEAKKQQQENEVSKIKEIVLKHLEKIKYHEEQAKEHGEKVKLLKKDLDDLKAGRLDRIEERHEKDPKAREVRQIEVHKIVEHYQPLSPWYSPFYVTWPPVYQSSITISSGTIATATTSGSNAVQLTGSTCQNFVGGTYSVGNNTINL